MCVYIYIYIYIVLCVYIYIYLCIVLVIYIYMYIILNVDISETKVHHFYYLDHSVYCLCFVVIFTTVGPMYLSTLFKCFMSNSEACAELGTEHLI